MRTIRINLFVFLLFSVSLLFAQSEVQDAGSSRNLLIDNPVWSSYFGIGPNDSLDIELPIIYDFEFVLEDLIGVETNKLDYLLKANVHTFHDYDDVFILKSGDTITLDPQYFDAFEFIYPENENLFRGEWFYDGFIENTSQYSRYFESEMNHNWDMRKYPFDVQKLKFKIEALRDTSLVRLNYSEKFPPFYDNVSSLKIGFEIDTITFHESFIETSTWDLDFNRNTVKSVGIFEIHLSRRNSWLFTKLFSGGVLSLLLAWMALFIPRKRDESRIELSIGSIFAAVGNKYFVDSAISSEVLTTADIINNLVILFVVLNTGYLVWQMRRKSKKDSLPPFFVFLISIMIFLLIVSLAILR